MADRDKIIRMAREAGFEVHDRKQQARVGMDALLGIDSTEKLERFAESVIANFLQRSGQYLTNDASREAVIADAVAEEREECAKLCDQEVARWGFHAVAPSAAAGCAVLIRARGQHG